MGFIDKGNKILRKEIQQGIRRRARLPARQRTGIVFYPGTEADFPQHFDVVTGALLNALGFN